MFRNSRSVRSLMQRTLISYFSFGRKLSRNQIIRFSRFMAGSESNLFVVRGRYSRILYVLNARDTAISRRIFIGLDDEHLKAVKALDWIRILSDFTPTRFGSRPVEWCNCGPVS